MNLSQVAAAFRPFDTLAAQLLPQVEDDAGDGSHDLSHLLRVWNNARRLQAEEGGDLRILLAADADFTLWDREGRTTLVRVANKHTFPSILTILPPTTLCPRIIPTSTRMP